MKLGHTNDEIKFSHTVGTVARYVVILDGEPTMHIFCDLVDETRTITIAPAKGNGGGEQATKGTFTTTVDLLTDGDGMPLGVAKPRVDEKSVYAYVVPRLHVLLGRLLRAA
jgi:hypothetical protein